MNIEREIARRQFEALVSREEQDIDLAYAALLIAKEEYPDLEVGKYLGLLDSMAEDLRTRVALLLEPADVVSAISQYLFHEKGFRGNQQEYYDPRNSFLNDVLDRRLGIPITLSLVYMEVGKRLGVPIVGVGLPGHFLVRHISSDEGTFIDTFQGGSPIGVDGCRQIVRTLYGGSVDFHEDLLRPVGVREMLIRILNNLKAVYLSTGDSRRALAALERITFLSPGAVDELRDRGLLYLRVHAYANALADLKRYLEEATDARDFVRIRGIVDLLMRQRTN